jgi:crotonobetaine/carnitine-CoA ligase
VWREFEQRFDVRLVEFYGAVDSPGFLLNDVGKIGTMGKPIGGVDFRVVDDHEDPLPASKVGELVFRHPMGPLTLYYKLPDATSRPTVAGGSIPETSPSTTTRLLLRGRKRPPCAGEREHSAWEIESVLNTTTPPVLRPMQFLRTGEDN